MAKIWPSLKEPGEIQLSKQNVKSTDLPLEEEDVSAARPNSYKVPAWSSESVLPIFHNSNLELIAKRQKNEQALNGVTIFLDPALGGDEKGYTLSSNASGNFTKVYTQAELNLLLAEKIAKKFESLGAQVILMRSTDMTMSDYERAARLAYYILGEFQKELKEQNFTSERLSDLRRVIGAEIAKGQDANYQQLFTKPGANSNLRLILDIEKQFQEMFYLRINYAHDSKNTDNRGYQLKVIKPILAAAEGSKETPAYMGYLAAESKAVAENMSAELLKIIPELKNSDSEGVVETVSDLFRFINIPFVEFSPGYLSHARDLSIIISSERQEIIAEAVANSLYAYLSEIEIAKTEDEQ
ncbi:MAG: N-acetylmuramoyl-L-alanine amidase [Eubacteriales bacterium]|nr:N-acetylmuramoyl-L-alanine amidase [Eubacteriales bacterium]